MGDALSMALSKVMGLSDDAIRKKMKKTPTAAGLEDGEVTDSAGADDEAHESPHKMAMDAAAGEPEAEGLSPADKQRLLELYEKMSKGE